MECDFILKRLFSNKQDEEPFAYQIFSTKDVWSVFLKRISSAADFMVWFGSAFPCFPCCWDLINDVMISTPLLGANKR